MRALTDQELALVAGPATSQPASPSRRAIPEPPQSGKGPRRELQGSCRQELRPSVEGLHFHSGGARGGFGRPFLREE
jgi:hypothetical protein